MNMKHWKNYSSWHWKKESKNLIGSQEDLAQAREFSSS